MHWDWMWIALVLACPLMMAWMMRGGHGHGRHDAPSHRSSDRERE